MAIDNDTSYELTGAQVKDLAQKIRNKADDNVFVGSSSSVAGSKGLVPAPSAGSQNSFLKGDGTWGIPERVVAFYISSWSLDYLGAYSPLYTDAAATTTYSGSLSDLIQLTQSGPVYFHWVYQGNIYASAIMSFAYDSNSIPLYDIYAAGVVKPYNGQYSAVPDVVYGQVLNNGGLLYATLQTTPAGGSSITVVQTTGSSTTSVMSQKAVTTALNNKNALIIREWS